MMDVNLLREALTVLSFAGFLGIVAFAASPRNKKRFEEAAMVPLEDDPLPNPPPRGREQTMDAVSRNVDATR